MPELIGGSYLLLDGQRIPQGGQSSVRKGVDARDGSFVAVKFVQASRDQFTKTMFDREVGSLRSLSHANIVRFRDSGIDDTGTYYIVLDWVDRSLKEHLEDQFWTDWAAFYEELFAPLVSALSHAHLKAVEHRDIKPANILLDMFGKPLLADFGISKFRGERTDLTVEAFRSAPYAPPEFETPQRFVRDVYALAVLALQCLTPNQLKGARDVAAALDDVTVPSEVRDVLRSCLDTDPSARPSSAVELEGLLAAAEREAAATRSRARHSLWLELTHRARQSITEATGSAADPALAASRDLAAGFHTEFGRDDAGELDRSWSFIYGEEIRYSAKWERGIGRLVVVAAKALSAEALEVGRQRSLAIPRVFTVVASRPADTRVSVRSLSALDTMLDQFYDRRALDEGSSSASSGENFDRWMRVLDARSDHARGESNPMNYESVVVGGRRATLTVRGDIALDLLGSEWEFFDPATGRRFGNGEVIEHYENTVVVLGARDLKHVPRRGSVRPYDAPSSIAIGRQRAALTAVKEGQVPNPRLREILAHPETNTRPVAATLDSWHSELDDAKQHAVRLAVGPGEMLVVEGPPGTGKTRFIVETVRQYLDANPGHRVLIASQTHVAVDNAVERLFESGLTEIVRLAGANESVVSSAVHPLLLSRRMPEWAEAVRDQAERGMREAASRLGIEVNHARAALLLEQMIADMAESERITVQMLDLDDVATETSDLRTAVDEQSLSSLQARLEHFALRLDDLGEEAMALLDGHMELPVIQSAEDAKRAVATLVGSEADSRRFLQRLALQAEWMERIEADDGLMSTFLAGCSVVAGTCIGLLRSRAVKELDFDLCIVDEASRATLTEALVPMARAKKWVLVGDTRQLPPSDEDLVRDRRLLEQHELEDSDVVETMFERFATGAPEHSKVLLSEQYRMIAPIGNLISTCFYDGRLRSPREDGLLGYETFAGAAVRWLDTSPLGERRRESSNEAGVSISNREEARILLDQLDTLDSALELGLIAGRDDRPVEVLAIAPYRSQVEELRRRVAGTSFRHIAVSVLSVDAVQGREADLVFLSITRSNAFGKLGFLGPDYWRRINVALSRARFGLTIIGDASFIRRTPGALKEVLAYIERNPRDCRLEEAK